MNKYIYLSKNKTFWEKVVGVLSVYICRVSVFLWNLHAKKPLVERSGKESIQQVLMDESQAQDTATETEPDTIQTRKCLGKYTLSSNLEVGSRHWGRLQDPREPDWAWLTENRWVTFLRADFAKISTINSKFIQQKGKLAMWLSLQIHVSISYFRKEALHSGNKEARRQIHPADTESSPFMVVVHEGRHGADLDGVRVVGWVFKEAIVWVEQLSGHEEEKLSGGSTVVQPADNTLTSSSCSASPSTTIQTEQIRMIYEILWMHDA